MDIRRKIENLVSESLKDLGVEVWKIALEHPSEAALGDYSTNVAMTFAKGVGENPRSLAEKIVNKMSRTPLDIYLEKVEVAGPGFINFFLSKDFFQNSVKEILETGENYGRGELYGWQKVMVEHTDPNPFKEFHIGHLMPNVIGGSIARILEWNGAEVKQVNYQGDVGLHVAKAVWGFLQTRDWKGAYAHGSKKYEESEHVKKEIQELNRGIYSKEQKIWPVYEEGRKASLEAFEEVYKKLGTRFDFYFFESEVGGFGKETVEINLGKIFEKGDQGTVVFRGEKFDKSLHTRVFVNSEGLPTYEAKELGLAKIKHDRYPYDRSVIITGNEIDDYFRVLLCAMRQVFPELAEKTLHISHGMLRLPTGKMSSRTGSVITAEQLINMVKEKVKGNENVAVGAIKYAILRQAVGRDIVFDIEKSVSTDGDSGVYLQYSYARAYSVLEKAREAKITNKMSTSRVDINMDITEVERLLYRFPEVVLRAGREFAPHHVAVYLTDLTRTFNSFYGREQIVDPADPASPYKVALTGAFAAVLKNGLNILGIPVLEKM